MPSPGAHGNVGARGSTGDYDGAARLADADGGAARPADADKVYEHFADGQALIENQKRCSEAFEWDATRRKSQTSLSPRQ